MISETRPSQLYASTWRAGLPMLAPIPKQPSAPVVPRFVALEGVGALTREVAGHFWTFGLGLPSHMHNFEVQHLSCGYRFVTPGLDHATVLVVGPDMLAGDVPADVSPELFTPDTPYREEENRSWVEFTSLRIVIVQTLVGDRRRFLLWVTTVPLQQALREAKERLAHLDPAADFQAEFARRLAWGTAIAADSATPQVASAIEFLAGRMRAPAGVFPAPWFEDGSGTPEGVFPVNKLFGLLNAYAEFDRGFALDCLRNLPAIQAPDGSIPAWGSASGARAPHPAWPMLSLTVQHLRRRGAMTAPGDELLGCCERFLGHALAARLDKERGLARWLEDEEVWTPETFDPDVAYADLQALLLLEIEAYRALTERPNAFDEEHRILREALTGRFWDAHRNLFMEQREGKSVRRATAGTLLALLVEELPRPQKESVFRALRGNQSLLGTRGMRQWEGFDDDGTAPPVRPHTQHLLLDFLLEDAPKDLGILAGSAWTRSFARLKELHAGFPDDLACEPEGAARLRKSWDLSCAAFCIRLGSREKHVDLSLSEYPGFVRWLERNRAWVVGVTVALYLTVMLSLALYYALLERKTNRELYAESGMAETHYTLGLYEKARDQYRDLLRASTRKPVQARYHFLIGKCDFHLNDLVAAHSNFQAAVTLDEDKALPAARWNLAQLHWRSGDTAAAIAELEEFRKLYGADFSELDQRAETALLLFQHAPPPETKVTP